MKERRHAQKLTHIEKLLTRKRYRTQSPTGFQESLRSGLDVIDGSQVLEKYNFSCLLLLNKQNGLASLKFHMVFIRQAILSHCSKMIARAQ